MYFSCVIFAVAVASAFSLLSVAHTDELLGPKAANTYRAAVIEHEVQYISTTKSVSDARRMMNANLDTIELSVQNASQQNADIVILGEMALTGIIFERTQMGYYLEQMPAPNLGPSSIACNNPAFNGRPITQRVSCLAKDNAVYLAINWGDFVPCNHTNKNDGCPSDNHFQYNTELVFNKDGELIAKYYKQHTYEATEFNSPPINVSANSQDFVTFVMKEYDNLEFGLFVCWDAIYSTPVIPEILQRNITNFIVSAWWNNQYAFFNAVSWWQSISNRYQINLLAAESWWTQINPWSSGSGIFSAGNTLQSWYNQKHVDIDNKLLIADVPIVLNERNADRHLPQIGAYLQMNHKPQAMCGNSMFWSPQQLRDNIGKDLSGDTKCGTLECSVEFQVTKAAAASNEEYWFLLVNQGYGAVPDGNNVFEYEEFCAFYKCPDKNGCWTQASQVADDTGSTVFAHIALTGNYPNSIKDDNVLFIQSTDANGNVYRNVMQEMQVTTDSRSGSTTVSYPALNDVLINLSVMGRPYNLDGVVV